MKLKIALIEDYSEWHFMIDAVLKNGNNFSVDLTCLWGEDFFERINNHHIDLVLLDISLPGTNGFEVAKRIINEHPKLPVIIFTSSYNASDFCSFYNSGIKAYLNKSRLIYLNDDLLKIMGMIDSFGYNFKPFTYQDIELVEMVCKKMTNREIAEQTKTTSKNIENRLARFCDSVKINHTRLDIFEFAVKYGFWNPWKP
jgi:DNA-binding NarL/FixJ family response regulator